MKFSLFFSVLCLSTGVLFAQAIIADHTTTDITRIPEHAIKQAKAKLHIGYGHTSHGSQITTGMKGLVAFANKGGKGLRLEKDIFAFNNGGHNGALDLEEGSSNGCLPKDVGYKGWAEKTRDYLNDPSHADVNVIMWSWCGQVNNFDEQGLKAHYLEPMSELEKDFPQVTFVYMTGHLEGLGPEGSVYRSNQQIRDFCRQHGKVLFDFADIEKYDPDGLVNYGDLKASDSCDYRPAAGGKANWAKDWQDSHTEGVDWYRCSSAHSQPLNANMKAYAAWWLFARLAGWNE